MEEKDLLQANATIIAGVLILVTISSVGERFPALQNSTEAKGIAGDLSKYPLTTFASNFVARMFIIRQ